MRTKRALIGLLLSGGIAASTLLVAAPANADVYQCSAGYVCGWHGADYAATFYQRNTQGDLPSAQRNKWSSVSNRTTKTVVFFRGTTYGGGSPVALGSNGTYHNLQGQGINDDIESFTIG